MLWRGEHLTADSHIVPKLAQHHWSPRVGDRVTAWGHVPAGDALDGNIQTMASAHGRWLLFLHWRNAIMNGYTRRVDPHTGRVRMMTWRELHQDLNAWGTLEAVQSWRDRHGNRPIEHLEGLQWAVRHHIVIAQEVKGPVWAEAQWAFDLLRAHCVATGHPAWVKRIVTLRFPKQTVQRAHNAHVQIAAIYGKGLRGRARRIAHTRRIQRRWGKVHFDAVW